MTHHYTGPKTLGVNLEVCDATAQHALGQVVEGVTNLGFFAKYKYVKFVDAVAYVLGHSVCFASATSCDVSNDRSGGASLAGLTPAGMVFQTTVPTTGQFGWVQISGIATFVAGSASIIAGDYLKPDGSSDGLSDEATAGTDENLVGIAMATVADNAAGLCMLQIRGT